jgi:hypothetical protein
MIALEISMSPSVCDSAGVGFSVNKARRPEKSQSCASQSRS